MHPIKNFSSIKSFLNLLIIISLFIPFCSAFLFEPNLERKFSKNDKTELNVYSSIKGDLVVGSEITFSAIIKEKFDSNIQLKLQLICNGEKCLKILGADKFEIKTYTNDTEQLDWKLKLNDNGFASLIVMPIDLDHNIELHYAHSLKQLKVGKSYLLSTFALIVGYIYFVAWMISLYPLLITNFNRKSVVGLNIDFVALNTTGYVAYAIYNLCLFFVNEFKEVYYEKFPGSEIPVQLNDVLFATHGCIINFLICFQCIFYERGSQSLTNTAKIILTSILSPSAILTVLYLSNGVNKYYYISFFSYCKLMLTLFKYCPQAYFNYKRKSTSGWSVYYCLLDFTGGSFSLLQMLLNSYNQDDYRNFTGNIGKVGLGLVSISFDVLFMLQHYVFYRHKEELILDGQQSNYGSSSSKQLGGSLNSVKTDNLNEKQFRRNSDDGVRNQAFDGN